MNILQSSSENRDSKEILIEVIFNPWFLKDCQSNFQYLVKHSPPDVEGIPESNVEVSNPLALSCDPPMMTNALNYLHHKRIQELKEALAAIDKQEQFALIFYCTELTQKNLKQN